jgi:3-dehydroquinate dehydratase/shikimate dehydrogenase
MTLLVTSVFAESAEEAEARARAAFDAGSDAVELRIDRFRDDPDRLAAFLKSHRQRTWIVTCRSAAEGGLCPAGPRERLALLTAATGGTNAFVDFELADRPVIEQDGRFILSIHQDRPPVEGLSSAALRALDDTDVRAVKVAYTPAHIIDSFMALDFMRRHGDRIIAVAMGPAGLWTRVLTKKLRAFASYCALSDEETTAPGQIGLQDMIGLYRWATINTDTKVYGLIGDPVTHSMSPFLFNRWFDEMGINAVYLPLQIGGEHGALSTFLSSCSTRPWLDIGGLSVTHPHKKAARAWLGTRADRTSDALGVVNTLVCRNGEFTGYNTDAPAALTSLTQAMNCTPRELRNITADVLGTGGAAHAVVSALRDYGCEVTVYGRSLEAAERLAHHFHCRASPWDERTSGQGRVLINCTTVGMSPHGDDSPMPAEGLAPRQLVFDLIYNPLQTRLLKDAENLGMRTVNGLDMFVRQAAMQFELWTGNAIDVDRARCRVERELCVRCRCP